MHGGIAVRALVLRQLLGPPPEEHLPATDWHGVEARGGVGDEGGVVGAHGGALLVLGVGGGGGLKTSSRRSSTAKPKCPPPPKKRSWPYVGTSRCSSVPKIFLSSGSVGGGSRWVALGSTLACFLSGVH